MLLNPDARGLTLLNPWAHAITHLGKTVENRSWTAPQWLDQILIHAGAGWDPEAPFFLGDLGLTAPMPKEIQTSAVVAVANLAHCCDTTVGETDARCGCGPWAAYGQYHWVLCDIAVLAEPVPCAGKLRLWRPSADVLAAVKEQVQ